MTDDTPATLEEWVQQRRDPDRQRRDPDRPLYGGADPYGDQVGGDMNQLLRDELYRQTGNRAS